MMESIVSDHVVKHMWSNELLTDFQHGFVSGRSCSSNLLAVLDAWTDSLDSGLCVDAIYLDFAKAFDTVPHQRLLTKLQGYGIREDVLGWIGQFLQGRRQRVSVNGSRSNWSAVTSGIPQGSVLGPALFVIFINDLPKVVQTTAQMFADDTKLFTSIANEDDREQLQEDLDRLVGWSKTWQLRFNAGKCKTLHLGRNNPHHSYTMESTSGEHITLEETVLEKDLGVHVDPELKFSKHVETQANKANRILGLIRRSYEHLDGDSVKKLFTALVRPHIEFCIVAWSPRLIKDKKLIEGVQRRATKLVPELKDLPYQERLQSLKLPSMSYRQARGDMIETYKYTHGFYNTNQDLLVRELETTTRGHSYKLKKRYCQSSPRQKFFSSELWTHGITFHLTL